MFRNIYRDFLKESGELIQSDELLKASEEYDVIAKLWKAVADLFDKIGETEDIKFVNEASEILIDLSEKEKTTMAKLEKACG